MWNISKVLIRSELLLVNSGFPSTLGPFKSMSLDQYSFLNVKLNTILGFSLKAFDHSLLTLNIINCAPTSRLLRLLFNSARTFCPLNYSYLPLTFHSGLSLNIPLQEGTPRPLNLKQLKLTLSLTLPYSVFFITLKYQYTFSFITVKISHASICLLPSF